MLDCYGCDRKILNDEMFILRFLNELPNALDMHVIKEPFLVPYDYNPDTWDNGGISAVVLIAESHISIHTFPGNGGYMSLDMFSCKEFDVESITELIKRTFKSRLIERNVIMRGTHFPKDKYTVAKLVLKQRKGLKKTLA